jgi:proteasome lid subunit RPN8/RPN11
MRIARALIDDIVAHAREEAPNECCGMIAARDGEAVHVYRMRNAEASPLRYRPDPGDQSEAFFDMDERGLQLGATYHSHTRSAPVPSQTDINLANPLLGDILYVIVGVAGEEPDVRAFRIEDGEVEERPLEVV